MIFSQFFPENLFPPKEHLKNWIPIIRGDFAGETPSFFRLSPMNVVRIWTSLLPKKILYINLDHLFFYKDENVFIQKNTCCSYEHQITVYTLQFCWWPFCDGWVTPSRVVGWPNGSRIQQVKVILSWQNPSYFCLKPFLGWCLQFETIKKKGFIYCKPGKFPQCA